MDRIKNQKLFKQQCYVNGEWRTARSGKTIDVMSPFDNSLLGQVPNFSATETNDAIEAAHAALQTWRNLTAQARGDILWRWAELIRDNREDLAIIITLEQGKPIAEARSGGR